MGGEACAHRSEGSDRAVACPAVPERKETCRSGGCVCNLQRRRPRARPPPRVSGEGARTDEAETERQATRFRTGPGPDRDPQHGGAGSLRRGRSWEL